MPLINMAKSSYGWSPLWLHHKMNPIKKNTWVLWFGSNMERSQGEKLTHKSSNFLPSLINR